MTTDYGQFVEANTVVLPISVDSIPTLKEFKAREKLSVDLLSDFKREVSRKYGVLNEDRFFSNRSYFVIDAEGTVQWAFVEERNGDRRENSELLSRLAAV
jgi:peroxiredoxin